MVKDLTGLKFGKLTVIKKVGRDKKYNTLWLCKCECGNEKIVARDKLVVGNTKSCGCAKSKFFTNLNKKHGLSHSRLWRVWCNIKKRCYYKNHKAYKEYGERGITVCEEWLNDFQAFHDWAMANGYNENAPKGQCTIDRINNNGNYEPNNCKWVSMKEQARNKRNNKIITYNGISKCLVEWAEDMNLNAKYLGGQIRKYGVEKVFSTLNI